MTSFIKYVKIKMVIIMDKKYKIMIPKYLTLFRVIITPIILFLGIMKWYIAVIIIAVIAFLTGILDNILNNIWKVNSKSRIKLDLFANKVLLLGITGSLMFKYHILIITFILDLIISVINIYFYNKKGKMEVLKIGKWKDSLYAITLLSYLFLFISIGKLNINYGFTYALINLQILSVINYLVFYLKYKVPSIENNIMHQEIMNNDNLEKTIVLNDINTLEKEIYDIEKDQD